jgi:uncharacterized protein
VTVHELSRADARRIAVRAQLLDPAELRAALEKRTLLELRAMIRPSEDLAYWLELDLALAGDG